MSGIAGIFNLDARPVDRAVLLRMTSAVSYRGPDGIRHSIDNEVGLGHCMMCNTPESLHEAQPLWDETGGFCLVMDGRIDNREELSRALESAGTVLRDDTDAELVLKAYAAWGEDSPRRIIGDFAYAIWDKRDRRLFCARDHLGIKPFYYFTNGRVFLWASELHQLLQHPAVPRRLNEGMVAEYVASDLVDLEETLFQGIYRLAPAHYSAVSARGVRKARYTGVDPGRTTRYRTDAQYAEHFLHLLKEAVRCRLRSSAGVGALLSGGLDSTSVVGVAHHLFCNGTPGRDRFETFSLVFPGEACDESTYIGETVRTLSLKSTLVCPEPMPRSYYLDIARRTLDFPGAPTSVMLDPLLQAAAQRSCRALLTGLGGDEWLTGAEGSNRFRIAVRRSLPDSLLPPVRAVLRAVRRRARLPAWVDSSFAGRVRLVDRITEHARCQSCGCTRGKLRTAYDAWHAFAIEAMDRSAASFGIEYRHPLYDQRIIEFALSLPQSKLSRGHTKFILRQATRGLYPDAIRLRSGKAKFSSLTFRTLQSHGGASIFPSGALGSGWFRDDVMRSLYRSAARSIASGDEDYDLWPIWMTYATNLWCGAVFYAGAPLGRETIPAGVVPCAVGQEL